MDEFWTDDEFPNLDDDASEFAIDILPEWIDEVLLDAIDELDN